MMRSLKPLLLLAILINIAGCSFNEKNRSTSAANYVPDETVNVIVDTDIDSDVDDVGALAVLYSYAQEGRANVLATVGSCNSGYAASCIFMYKGTE